MEYVEGETFSRLIRATRKKGEHVPPGIALRIMTAVLHGLHAAHDARGADGELLGVVHRDVAPDNILVGTDGFPRVVDFGIARALNQTHMTQEGQVKGKLPYMAPEQVLGEPITHKTDIFAASAVLWQALTSRRLFQVRNAAEAAYAIMHKKIEPPSAHAKHVDAKYDEIVMKGLSREPTDRWETALDMAEALEALGGMATQRQVSAWVKEHAAERLAEMAAKVKALESTKVGALPKRATELPKPPKRRKPPPRRGETFDGSLLVGDLLGKAIDLDTINDTLSDDGTDPSFKTPGTPASFGSVGGVAVPSQPGAEGGGIVAAVESDAGRASLPDIAVAPAPTVPEKSSRWPLVAAGIGAAAVVVLGTFAVLSSASSGASDGAATPVAASAEPAESAEAAGSAEPPAEPSAEPEASAASDTPPPVAAKSVAPPKRPRTVGARKPSATKVYSRD
jgi:serine/threonine-protein kinase